MQHCRGIWILRQLISASSSNSQWLIPYSRSALQLLGSSASAQSISLLLRWLYISSCFPRRMTTMIKTEKGLHLAMVAWTCSFRSTWSLKMAPKSCRATLSWSRICCSLTTSCCFSAPEFLFIRPREWFKRTTIDLASPARSVVLLRDTIRTFCASPATSAFRWFLNWCCAFENYRWQLMCLRTTLLVHT